MAEAVLLFVVLLAPVLLGALASHLHRPWWEAAIVAVILSVLAAVLPEPEAGESRVASGDIGFLVAVALVVIGLTWLGAAAHRRVVRNR